MAAAKSVLWVMAEYRDIGLVFGGAGLACVESDAKGTTAGLAAEAGAEAGGGAGAG